MQNLAKLKESGLTDKEARVYLASLRLGNSSITKIREDANLPKTSTYEALKTLGNKGLVSTYRKSGVQYFSASDPDTLKTQLEKRVSAIDSVLPQLKKLLEKQANHPNVRYYDTNEGAEVIVKEIITDKKELLGIGSADDLGRIPEIVSGAVAGRKKFGIPCRAIYGSSKVAHERKKIEKKNFVTVKIVEPSEELPSMLLIWGNKLALLSITDQVAIAVIEDDIMSQIARSMFELIWEHVPEVA